MTDKSIAEFEAVRIALEDLPTRSLFMLAKDYSAELPQTIWTQFIATTAAAILAARDVGRA
jgi:hypothetical protein